MWEATLHGVRQLLSRDEGTICTKLRIRNCLSQPDGGHWKSLKFANEEMQSRDTAHFNPNENSIFEMYKQGIQANQHFLDCHLPGSNQDWIDA